MKKKAMGFLAAGVLLLALFMIFTVLVQTVDVRDIEIKGPQGEERAVFVTSIGFARLNLKVFRTFGESKTWYKITEALGIVAILTAAAMACLGVWQWIRRKSLKKVDSSILLLGGFYIVVILFYVLFEFLKVNYRPIMPEGVPEASYPSSHTMLTVFVMLTAVLQIHRLFPFKKTLTLIFDCAAMLIAGFTAAGRIVSGYHWFTDVAAGGLLALSLVVLYIGADLLITDYKVKREAVGAD